MKKIIAIGGGDLRARTTLKIDEYIAKAKAEEKYLKIPDENEEKVLQNEE